MNCSDISRPNGPVLLASLCLLPKSKTCTSLAVRHEFLGDFAYSREARISFAMSVRLTVTRRESALFPLHEF